MQRYALIEQYSKLIRSGYFTVAWAVLQALLYHQPIVIHESDNAFFLSGSAIWLINNFEYTHDKHSITIQIS